MAGGLSFSLEVLGDVQVEREFLRWGERALNAGPLWDVLHESLMDMEYEQFHSEGSHGSGGWTPLKPATVAAKQAAGYPDEILQRTETLLRSLTTPNAEGAIFENYGDWFRYGTDVFYAIFHQRGTKVLPVRKIVQLTEAERVALARSVQRFIVTGEVSDPRLVEVY